LTSSEVKPFPSSKKFGPYADRGRVGEAKRARPQTRSRQDPVSTDRGRRANIRLFDLRWREAEVSRICARASGENCRKRADLVPVVLEQNVLPPPNLSAFHFNDRISYLISRKL
jgi:hypothetical protein